jgi:hypothetical protein
MVRYTCNSSSGKAERQGDTELETSLGYKERSCLTKPTTKELMRYP